MSRKEEEYDVEILVHYTAITGVEEMFVHVSLFGFHVENLVP